MVPRVIYNFWVKALTLYFLLSKIIMIPNNKNIAVLHPYVNKMWWAVKMMIYLSNFLQEKNNLTFYTFSYNKSVFLNERIDFEIKYYFKNKILKILSFFIIAFKIRKSDYIIIWNSPMHFVWVLSKILFFSKAKLIWWNHHYPWYYSKNTNIYIRLKRIIEKIAILKIDLVIANSKYLKNIIDNIWTINSKILNPVLDEEFLNFNKQINKKENILFSYSRWTQGKNLQMIFQTYEKLKKSVPNLILIIWWVWEELDKFKLKYKNQKNIKFLWILAKEQIIDNLIKTKIFYFHLK